MADKQLRQIERDAALDQSPDATARVLTSLVRYGQLDHQMLELAALCGHKAARIATDRNDIEQDCCSDFGAGCKLRAAGLQHLAESCCSGDYLKLWLNKLVFFGRIPILIASFAAAKIFVGAWEIEHGAADYPDDDPDAHCMRRAIQAMSDWILEQNVENEKNWSERQVDVIERFGTGLPIPNPADMDRIIIQRILKVYELYGHSVRSAVEDALIDYAIGHLSKRGQAL